MKALPAAHSILRKAELGDRVADDLVTLDYDQRFLRRKVLHTETHTSFLVDLAETVSLDHGDCFRLSDNCLIGVVAAPEDLIEIRGDGLIRLAWHIGNRHTPCQIGADRLLIRQDEVMVDMLRRLGAQITPLREPFRPEGGAYGMGRTHGHDHSHGHSSPDGKATAGAHSDDGHSHAHAHSHDTSDDRGGDPSKPPVPHR
ncbi:urease accessory protein UreE [Pseudooceanicola sp.]|uniref:urease accessory protein UreE n=1 Tax=Pseudooceanicola sp. TaxID=1914328 RepID=UPI00405A354A